MFYYKCNKNLENDLFRLLDYTLFSMGIVCQLHYALKRKSLAVGTLGFVTARLFQGGVPTGTGRILGVRASWCC